jgi:hypothetical protein
MTGKAALTTDAGTLHAVALGRRPIADAAGSGERLDGDPRAISGLTGLLRALTSSPRPEEPAGSTR